MTDTSNFARTFESIKASYDENGNLDDVIDVALSLEKNLTVSNTNIAKSLFSSKSESGSSTGNKINRMSDTIDDLNTLKISADTSSERNDNTKFSYIYHFIYIFLSTRIIFWIFSIDSRYMYTKNYRWLKL